MRRPSADLSEPSRNLEESLGPPTPDSLDADVDLSIPPAESVIESEQPMHDDAQTPSPPLHVAARFYRPTQNRRKDSAASSRRNSISSAHSRSSHGRGDPSGPQSKYVAQHLRRASIIEDRKARLADRAAHAEKVRLRAVGVPSSHIRAQRATSHDRQQAMAKAATRGSSVSEERAIAAQQARERNLAGIAAACAEEVKRAKAVAEHIKEKREQEVKKMRMQMEERLAEAERRREELQRRNTSKTRARGPSIRERKALEVLPEVQEVAEATVGETKPRTPRQYSREDAAEKIQWHWRAARRRRAVARFSQLGLTVDGVRDTSFEEVTQLLGEESVIVTTAAVLRICGLQEGSAGSIEEMTAARTFLSAFLILGHPAQVLSNNKPGRGDQEQVGEVLAQPIPRDDLANPQLQDLVGKARDLLISFETVLSRLTVANNFTPPPALRDALPEVYATFYNAFIAWKARDSSALIDVMVMQFVELDAIWQTVKDSTDGSVDEVYRQSIKENQVMLLVRIKKLAGPQQGKKMIFDAVAKARRARAAKAPAGDAKPREVEQGISSENALGQLSQGVRADRPEPGPSAVPPANRSHAPTLAKKPVKMDIGSGLGSLLPDNRIVVHELAINREYRILPDEFRKLRRESMDLYFKGVRLTMDSQDREAHCQLLVLLAENMREKLQRLVRPGHSMHTIIGEMLDTEMLQREFMAGNFSYDKFFAAMGSLLPKLCAPIRDDEVKDLVDNKFTSGNYVDRLEALMAFIEVMMSDYTNHLLSVAAPGLVASAPAYEAKTFATGLEAGTWDLVAAETAWRSARAKVLAEAARRDPEGVNHQRSRPAPDHFYNQMLVDVFTQLSPISADDMPAMLRLDHTRAVACGQDVRRAITAGAILLQCKNMLKRDVRAPWKLEASRIMTVLDQQLEAPATVDGIMAALEAGRSMPAATKAHLRAFVTRIVAAGAEAANGTALTEPVLRLLLTRLRAHMLVRLGAASASEKVRATSTAAEKLAGLGLAEFVDRVRDMVNLLARVGAVDREAHAMWWEEVARKVEAEETADA